MSCDALTVQIEWKVHVLSSKCIPETLISALVGLSPYEFLLCHLIQLPWTLLDKWLSLSHVVKLGMSSKIILSNSGWCWTVKEEGCSSFQVWIFKWSLLLCSGFYERQYLGISPIHRLVVTEYIFRVKCTKWFKISSNIGRHCLIFIINYLWLVP